MTMFNNGRTEKQSVEAGRTPRGESPFSRPDSTDLLGPDSLSHSPLPSLSHATTAAGPTPPDKCENVLAVGAKWKGTLTVDTSVRVDGNFSGQIESKATVHVADGALVDAKIRAAFVVISGTFRGEIRCDQRVDLLPHSRVEAEVITKVLVVEEGALFDGHVQMTQGESSRAGRSRIASTEAETPERRLASVGAEANGSEAAEA
jgi:cytoskeletal protein CcmA (bactofilin family)